MSAQKRRETPIETVRRTAREIEAATTKVKELRAERIDAMRRAVADGERTKDVADAGNVAPEYVSKVAPRGNVNR